MNPRVSISKTSLTPLSTSRRLVRVETRSRGLALFSSPVVVKEPALRFYPLYLLCICYLTACASRAPLNPEAPLLLLRPAEIDSIPRFDVIFSNITSTKVRFARTFGYDEIFLNLEILRDGAAYEILGGEVFYRHRFVCLEPGKSETVRVDFHSLSRMPNGGVYAQPEVHELPQGHYRVRARYWDSPNAGPSGCPSIDGVIFSEWLEFDVPSN